jgi:hypothetical protein
MIFGAESPFEYIEHVSRAYMKISQGQIYQCDKF